MIFETILAIINDQKMIQNYLKMIKIDQKNPVNDQKIIFRDIFQLSKLKNHFD